MTLNTSWQEVTQEEFFRVIGPQDVSPRLVPGRWPYTSLFKTPRGEVRGKVVDMVEDIETGGRLVTTYFLPCNTP